MKTDGNARTLRFHGRRVSGPVWLDYCHQRLYVPDPQRSPAVATSYAYVNPVVAVLLGTGFAGEVLSTIEWLALGVIVFAVVLVTLGKYLLPAKPIVTACEVEKP